MEITFAPKGILQINDARITHKNFKGLGGKYNREGDRNFSIIIPDEAAAEALTAEGWNVKVKPPREEGDEPFMYMKVKVKFNDYGPNCYLTSGNSMVKLNEGSIGCLDDIRIESVSLDISPSDWEMFDGRTGRTAYLRNINVIQDLSGDRFAAEYQSRQEAF